MQGALCGLFLLGLLNAKIVDLIEDPFMKDLNYWYNPSGLICTGCSTIGSVVPAVAGGNYVLQQTGVGFNTNEGAISADIDIPANVEFVNLTLAVQVGGGCLYSLRSNFNGFKQKWSVWELELVAVGRYINFSVPMNISPASTASIINLKLTIDANQGQYDYISINEVHLLADIPEIHSNTEDSYKILVIFGTLGLIIFVGAIFVVHVWPGYRMKKYKKVTPVDSPVL